MPERPDQSGLAPRPIAFCITELDPGGAERAMARLVRSLHRERWSPHVFCLGPDTPLAGEIRSANVPVTCLDVRRRFDVGVVWRLKRQLRNFRPALIQSFLFHANIVSRLAAPLAGVPIVVSGIRVADREHPWHIAIERATRGLVTHHVCVSEGVARFARDRMRIALERTTVIPNAIDVEAYQHVPAVDFSTLGLPPGARVLVNVGRLSPQKGQDVLLAALGKLVPSFPDLHLVIAGEGPLESGLRQQARQLQIEDRVHLIGRSRDVPSLLRGASAFVLTSRWEGMPNVVLEAMAAGCPVVSTAAEGIPELLGNDEFGLRVPIDSVPELVSAIGRVLTDRDAAADRTRSAVEHLRQQFSVAAITAQYERLYSSLIECNSQQGQ